MSQRLSAIIVLASALALAACSSSSNAPPAPAPDAVAVAKANAAAQAEKSLKLYEQMRATGSLDIAAQVGAEAVAKYPDSAAAAKIRETLGEVTAKAKEEGEARRLARLWAYTVTSVKGGTQYAGSIENEPPLAPPGLSGKDAKHVHLILRQHPEWGQTVYLILDNEKFNCKSGCKTLSISFDGEPAKPWKATIPPTGEPALFIDDDKAFIARVLKTKKVAIEVNLVGDGRKTLVFETGGLDMSHLPNTTKKK
ncbi:MAG: hypothetical protein JSS16_15590 [Proteobacteria bacterium]|uniref:hypothetical protein n=1 Tax=Rudaea sp. TaxID=2136325 RepID=UPI001D5FACEB|nr:hypothetical protein [Pseudomonadota bacterium]MBS0568430.1 hypothetical protein [Pseudomonadota bacterium]